MIDLRDRLREIRTFPSLVKFLRDELDWPLDSGDDFEELTFDYTPEELGIDEASAAKIEEIKRLRPLVHNQPWGIFFVKFEAKQLPVVALRRILNRVVVKKRATGSAAEQKQWVTDDLLFISAYGDDAERRISFAHFSRDATAGDLPTLKVLAWDEQDTGLHLDDVARRLVEHLSWPAEEDEWDDETWRERWSSAFALRHREVVTTSKALAIHLAELARGVRARINEVLEIESDDGPVTGLMDAFREALVHDLEPDDFADMYAQTIAYGLLSARIANPGGESSSLLPVTNPFLKELMEAFLHIGDGHQGGDLDVDFDELGVSEVIELLDDANMEAVVRDFGDENPFEDPVIHFYELFLKEYDAKKRMQRGVFYTPRPIVSYIVRSVHELLRAEFGLEDGLADTSTWGEVTDRLGVETPKGVNRGDRFVTILDPATGTGTFLVEVIDVIRRTLLEKWTAEGKGEAEISYLWNEYVPTQLLPRLHGYELLMAPYAIAHLKIGLKLHETGYRFQSDERARIFLTNALEPAQDFADRLEFAIPALAHEALAVNSIKTQERFTIVIGNPPYAGHSANTGKWISDLLRGAGRRAAEGSYFEVDGEPLGERNPKWLNDDYVKFIRFGQELVSSASVGMLGLITNHGYLGNPTFRGMRQSLMCAYDEIHVLDLHGSTKKRERTPTGEPDENVFEILPGVAILLGERKRKQAEFAQAQVAHSDLWGAREAKYDALLANDASTTGWSQIEPSSPFYLFVPQDTKVRAEYEAGRSLLELFPVNVLGFQTHRDSFAVAFDRAEIADRIAALRDRAIETDALRSMFGLKDNRDWKLDRARRSLQALHDWENWITECAYRPFDQRWCYFSDLVMDYPRKEIVRHVWMRDNLCLVSSRQQATLGYRHCWVTELPPNDCLVSTKSREANQVFPLYTFEPRDQDASLIEGARSANVSEVCVSECQNLWGLEWTGHERGDLKMSFGALDILACVYATLNSPGYRTRYGEFLKIDFPRVPWPASRGLLRELTRLGQRLIDLHLSRLPDHLPLPKYHGPATGAIGRFGWSQETIWLDTPGPSGDPNDVVAGFYDVPAETWSFEVGGHQVCRKWLSDRKGRVLGASEISQYQRVVAAISETIRLMAEIDVVIDDHGGWPGAFAVTEGAA